MPKRVSVTRRSVQVDESLHARLEWMDESEGGGDHSSVIGPPSLYVDDRTILEEVRDIRALRKGDHCIVGLNAVRKLHWTFDWLTWWLGKWGVLRMYHHFIMMSDVDSVEYKPCECHRCQKTQLLESKQIGRVQYVKNGCERQKFNRGGGPVPLNKDGSLSMICEYSGTPVKATKVFLRDGPSVDCWKKMAPFHKIPLADYVHNTGTSGIFRVVRDSPLNEDELEAIMKKADVLLNSYEPYDFFWRNCESAAFALNPGTKRWMTPEVPMLLWNMFRMGLALIGVICLFYIKEHGTHFPSDICRSVSRSYLNLQSHMLTLSSSSSGGDDENASLVYSSVGDMDELLPSEEEMAMDGVGCSVRIPLEPLFHFFVTAPVGLQLMIHLVRSTVHLTSKRTSLGERSFHHLLAKEVGRTLVVGAFCMFGLNQMPTLVQETRTVWLAAFFSLCGYTVANSAYGAVARAVIEFFKISMGGVPVVTFFEGGTPPRVKVDATSRVVVSSQTTTTSTTTTSITRKNRRRRKKKSNVVGGLEQ